MDQVEVHVGQAKPFQRRVASLLNVVRVMVMIPQLGRDENVLTRDAAIPDCPAYTLLGFIPTTKSRLAT
jgi:hypothetical protein